MLRYGVVLSAMLMLGLTGCGQIGPLYPKSELDKPEHQYDQFLLLPDTSKQAAVANANAKKIPLPSPPAS